MDIEKTSHLCFECEKQRAFFSAQGLNAVPTHLISSHHSSNLNVQFKLGENTDAFVSLPPEVPLKQKLEEQIRYVKPTSEEKKYAVNKIKRFPNVSRRLEVAEKELMSETSRKMHSLEYNALRYRG